MIYLDVKLKGKSYKIYNDQTYIGFLYRSDFNKLDIPTPSDLLEVSEEKYEEIRKAIIYRAFDKGVSYLADSERSAYDVSLKLRMKDFPEYAIEEAIELLYEYNYLNDRRFAESYIRSYMSSKSKSMIRKELSKRHINLPDLDELFSEVYTDEEVDEASVIEELIRKKYGGQDMSDEKVKRRAVSFLLRHGFSFEQINNYLT